MFVIKGNLLNENSKCSIKVRSLGAVLRNLIQIKNMKIDILSYRQNILQQTFNHLKYLQIFKSLLLKGLF